MKRKSAVVLSVMFSVLFVTNTMAQTSKLVPARKTLENLGFVSQWDAGTKTAVFKNDGYTVSVTSGNDYFEVNGKKITFDDAAYENIKYNVPVIINGSFYLPGEELAQAIGAEVIEDTVVYVKPDDKAVSLELDKQRLSDIKGITNARQLGGYVNTEGRAIKQNVIIRTGAPSSGTENDLKLLAEKYHVSDMVDFRMDFETQRAPEPTVEGAVNHAIKLNIAGDMSEITSTDEFKKEYAEANGEKGKMILLYAKHGVLPTPKMYDYFLGDEAADGYRQFFDILLNKPEDSAVLFHCSQGKDRTGMGAALFLYALDFDDDTVMADYLLTNEANAAIIENDVKEVSKYTDDPEMLERTRMMDGVSAELLQSALDKMKAEYGSIKGYLKTRLSLTDAELTKLKEIYLESTESEKRELDYLVYVTKNTKLPDYWEDTVELVHVKNSLGDDVAVEKKTYAAYLELKADLEKDGIYIDLDSAFRSIAEQQAIVDDFTVTYGDDYVAVPGFSEHHTGLALNIDGEDVYLNEDMVEYPEIWAKIHEKLADHGFILRYLDGKEDITGYSYEPWHIRYVDSVEIAKEIAEKNETFEEYLGKHEVGMSK